MAVSGGGRQRRRALPGEEYLSLRRGSPHWQIDLTIDGFRHRESSGTTDKAEAAALAAKAREALWRRVKMGEEAPRQEMTLQEAWTRFYAEVAKGTTYGEGAQRHHARLLLEELGKQTLLSTLNDERVSRLVSHFRTRPAPSAGHHDGLSPATINRYVGTLGVICRRATEVWGAAVGGWQKGRHHQKEPKGREVFLDHVQAKRLMSEIVPHARPIVLFDLMTGLRKENVIGLRWEQINMTAGHATMIQKGGKPHTVVLVPQALQLLAGIEPDPDKRLGPVWRFGNPHVGCRCSVCSMRRNAGRPIRSIRRSFETAAVAAGLRADVAKTLRFHDLRHTFASWVLAEGDLKLVQEALGHSNIATTARYAHLLPGRKAAAITGAVADLFPREATG